MSNTMHDVMGAAKNGMDSARETTEHVLSSAKSGAESVKKTTEHTVASVLQTVLKGASTAAEIVATLRKLDRDDGLSWFGLSRRRSPLVSVALFGSGLAVGAGIGMLFAPMTGADLRQTLLGRSRNVAQKGADSVAAAETAVKDAAKDAAEKAGEMGDDVKKAAKRAEHKVEGAVSAAKTTVDGAVSAAKSTIEHAVPAHGAASNYGDGVPTAKA